MAALMLLVLPLQWLAAILLAAVIHESCHLLCLRLCNVPVFQIHIGLQGAAIETAPLPPASEILCAAAGPAGSLLCLIFMRSFPMLALCGFLQGIYNLLPVYPLDGGRILHSLAILLVPAHAERICSFVLYCTAFAITLFGLWLYWKTLEPVFLLFTAYFLPCIALCRKTPCKESRY